MNQDVRHWRPIDWLPAGLITWYEPDGRPVALVTTWMALFCGDVPSLRAAWRGGCGSCDAWEGGDFVLNVPDEECLPRLRELVADGLFCLDASRDLDQDLLPGDLVEAPRLSGCSLQFECRDGSLSEEGSGSEVAGEVVLFHRYGVVHTAKASDLCHVNPFSAQALLSVVQ